MLVKGTSVFVGYDQIGWWVILVGASITWHGEQRRFKVLLYPKLCISTVYL